MVIQKITFPLEWRCSSYHANERKGDLMAKQTNKQFVSYEMDVQVSYRIHP